MRPSSRSLKRLLAERPQVVAAGAHDALSAKLVEQAGFDAIWASGFGLSAVRAVPDASILTMSETLEATRAMVEATSIPVIADCDTGFGNAINVMRTVADFEAAGVAAISIEDNVFPKRCSFYAGVARELVPAEEHARKVAAAKAAQRSDDFIVIARTEALIAGWGKEEALSRARAYADAGADAVLIHSKHPDLSELAEVAAAWDRDVPLVSVPTTYIGASLEELERTGFKLVIYANQALRAALDAMKDALRALRSGEAAVLEKRIAPLEDVYAQVGVSELKRNEALYLLPGGFDCSAVILAAGDDGALGDLTRDRPKSMLDIKGKTILERQVEALNTAGVKDIAVVRGHQKGAIHYPNLRYYDNEHWATTGEVASLMTAEDELRGPVLCLYGDVIFDDAILGRLLRAQGDVVIAVDRAYYDHVRAGNGALPARPHDLVVTEEPPVSGYRFVPSTSGAAVKRIGRTLPQADAHGEFIGLALLSERGAKLVREVHAELARTHRGPFHEADSLSRAALTDLLQELIDRGHTVTCVDVYKGWMEVDTFEDYRRAWSEIRA
ncbi:isocitrate lyase/phosphoenolpyruvate mutase family protein [Candidatus Binatia bacterium]|jgi:phosphoenolpyruvate phosphomutase|nr:isocitrate lyase/phosphoenolpyruvate mutase family protein [Candidatus Binatia bacterium]